MSNDGNLLPRYIMMQKQLLASVRLKDVLDSAVMQFADLAGGAKVAIFLSDNESLALKLMAAKGYSDASIEYLKVLPFSAESLLKYVVQKRAPVSANNPQTAPDISSFIMKKESSSGQIALPLISSNLLVGAVLLEVNNPAWLNYVDFLKEVADVTALVIANSILFGRSEYERERLNTLYKTSRSLSSSALRANEVLQIAADTALVLANCPSCAVLIYDAATNNFQLGAYKGLDGNSLVSFDMSVQSTVAGAALRSKRTEYIGDGSREPYGGLPRAAGGASFASMVALPLINDHQPIGVLVVFSTESRAFHREQVELLESLAEQVTVALHTAFTHESTAANAATDAHTGLYNRAHFEESLLKEVERSGRHRHELGLLLIDIDHLGQLNQHLGEDRGDEAIRFVGSVIKTALRDIDVCCRFGGEEFAVILPETHHQGVTEVAERLRQKIKSENCPGVGTLTVSIGMASYPFNADSAETLLKAADEALNVAKYEGRDKVMVAQVGQGASTGPISWEELAKAAKFAVISERQAHASQHSRLEHAPEYAAWMTKTPQLVKKKDKE